MTEAVAIANEVIVANGNPFTTLSFAPQLPPVTVDTPLAEARRNYMRLAALIHPDKLGSSFARSTEAFQCLVRAFECFANPKERAKAAAELARAQKKQAGKVTTGKKKTEEKKAPKEKKPKEKVAQPKPSKIKKTTREESSAEEEESDLSTVPSESEEEDDDADADIAERLAEKPPAVSTSRTPIGAARIGGIYVQTNVGCPQCRTKWDPDFKQQYSLFMGEWGKKIHCQLCLFRFGSATALHSCPHCTCPFDYDASMYESTIVCKRCKATIGFPYFPVSQMAIDQVHYDEWKEEHERMVREEREARLRARHGGASADEERTEMLIGQCMVDEQCPLCKKRVHSKHRAHVEACVRGAGATQVEEKPAAKPKRPRTIIGATKTIVAEPKKATRPAAPAPKKASRAVAPRPKKAAPKKKKAQRKRKRSYSDSDSEDDYSSDESD